MFTTRERPASRREEIARNGRHGVGLVAALIVAPVLIVTAARPSGTVKPVGQPQRVTQLTLENRYVPREQGYSEVLMRKLLVLLYQPYKWLIYFPFLIVSTLVFGTLAIILSTLMNQKVGSFIGGAVWARLNSYLIPIRVKVTGKDHIENSQSYVIVANHQSQVDILVLYGWLGIDFKWVLKQELRKIPGLGIGCEKVGHIFIDRADPQQAMTALKVAQPTVVNGTSVLFFPEGTRGTAGKMGDFKKGAFRFALETGLPLLPITLINTGTLLPPHTLNLRPGRVKMIIHEKIEVSGYTPQHLDELMRRAKNTILAGLEKDS